MQWGDYNMPSRRNGEDLAKGGMVDVRVARGRPRRSQSSQHVVTDRRYSLEGWNKGVSDWLVRGGLAIY